MRKRARTGCASAIGTSFIAFGFLSPFGYKRPEVEWHRPCTVNSIKREKMEATTTTYPQEAQLLVSISDMSMLKDIKKAISMVKGVTKVKTQKAKPRLYDPETGEYLNDKTMKVIEDAHKGIGVTHYDSLQDFYKEMGL